MKIEKGTIVLTKFPFTDLSATKRRPAMVVSSSNMPGDDVIVAFISTRIEPLLTTAYLIDQNHPDYRFCGFKQPSVVKLDKLVTVSKKIITGELGKVSNETIKQINDILKLVFDITP